MGAYNSFKAGNYAGMIGEHGFGMGLYVTGLYLSAATMFTEGLDIMLVVAGFPFKIMMLRYGTQLHRAYTSQHNAWTRNRWYGNYR